MELISNQLRDFIQANTTNIPIEELRARAYNKRQGDLKGIDCPICKNKGYIAVFENDVEFMRECSCMKPRRSISRMEKSGLSSQLGKCTFDNYIASEEWQKRSKATALKFLNSNGEWFYAGGQSGAGKTHLCTAIVGEMLKQGKSAKYMLWRDEIVKLKANVNDDIAYSRQMDELKSADVLYIDDFFKVVGGNKPTGGDINIAFELLNFRYNDSKLITIISSELITDEIIDIDEAIAGRIISKSKGYCINLLKNRDRNYRLKGADNGNSTN